MKANGSRREEKGGKNITEKIRCVPRSEERKTVGRRGWWAGVGGGGRCGGRVLGAGRRVREPAPGGRAVARWRGAAGHTPSGNVARRSSLAKRPTLRAAAVPTRRRRPAPREHSRPNYMSKVLKSVLPIATARVLPQLHEPDPTYTPIRVSRYFSESAQGVSVLSRTSQKVY